jgi:hypothetical protein
VISVRIADPGTADSPATGTDVVAIGFRPVDIAIDGVRMTADEMRVDPDSGGNTGDWQRNGYDYP